MPEQNVNIFKKPIVRSDTRAESKVSLCVDLLCKNQKKELVKVSSGTGFFHRRKGRLYFITNWHVITGRDPRDPSKLINGHRDSPVAIEIHIPRKDNPNHYFPSGPIPLYRDEHPGWFESEPVASSSNTEEKIDLVAIEIPEPADDDWPLITTVETFSTDGNDYIYVGRDVVIIGYPFGMNELNPYPIWKRGYVASEPSILIGGMPKFYIDSPGRPGMSGSPIFMLSEGIEVPPSVATALNEGELQKSLNDLNSAEIDALANAPKTQILKFVGVYSGAVGDDRLERLKLGIAWHGAMVDRLFSHPYQGCNPYPPINL